MKLSAEQEITLTLFINESLWPLLAGLKEIMRKGLDAGKQDVAITEGMRFSSDDHSPQDKSDMGKFYASAFGDSAVTSIEVTYLVLARSILEVILTACCKVAYSLDSEIRQKLQSNPPRNRRRTQYLPDDEMLRAFSRDENGIGNISFMKKLDVHLSLRDAPNNCDLGSKDEIIERMEKINDSRNIIIHGMLVGALPEDAFSEAKYMWQLADYLIRLVKNKYGLGFDDSIMMRAFMEAHRTGYPTGKQSSV